MQVTFGEAIRLKRGAMRLRMRDLVQMTGYSEQSIREVEFGARVGTPALRSRLSQVLGIPQDLPNHVTLPKNTADLQYDWDLVKKLLEEGVAIFAIQRITGYPHSAIKRARYHFFGFKKKVPIPRGPVLQADLRYRDQR